MTLRNRGVFKALRIENTIVRSPGVQDGRLVKLRIAGGLRCYGSWFACKSRNGKGHVRSAASDTNSGNNGHLYALSVSQSMARTIGSDRTTYQKFQPGHRFENPNDALILHKPGWAGEAP